MLLINSLNGPHSIKKCNSFGIKLLDLCKSTNIRVVNGRLGEDHGKDSFTFVSHGGASVVDYLLTD